MTDQRKVPFFPYPQVFLEHREEILRCIDEVASRGAYILQNDVYEFEAQLAERLGARHALGVGNATDALYMLCRACGLGEGDEVIFCTHTMVATAAGIQFAGAAPVPVEAGRDHEIDPASVASAITPRTKAIMPTQLNGRCADMDALRAIAQEHGLMILEDSAQALGATFGGQAAGTFGKGGVISFYPAKILGALGDAGCVVTNDDEVHEQCRLYRDHGRLPDQDVACWCLNSRLDNIQAAILSLKLAYCDQWIERRRAIARMYDERLRDLDELVLPPPPEHDPERYDVFQNYEIEAEKRDGLKEYLGEQNIGTLLQWGGKPVHMMRKLGFTQSLPFTEDLFARMLLLPMNHFLSDEDVECVCQAIHSFYRSGRHSTEARTRR